MYPNYKNKHLEESLFHPEDFLKYAKLNKKDFPQKYVLVFQSSSEKYIKRKYNLKKTNTDGIEGIRLYKYRDIGIVKVVGIGAPHTCTLLEELIALGAKEFIMVGTAGGLEDRGVYVCDRAIRDEGTSHHYISPGKYAYPDSGLTKRFANSMKKMGLEYHKGTTWTVDAPYRETRAEVLRYKKDGVKTVEMEASALFSVAKYRKVKMAAAFSVSDLLIKEWKPEFESKHVADGLNITIDAAINCLTQR